MACVIAGWRHRCVPLFETVLLLRIPSLNLSKRLSSWISTILKKLDTNTGRNTVFLMESDVS